MAGTGTRASRFGERALREAVERALHAAGGDEAEALVLARAHALLGQYDEAVAVLAFGPAADPTDPYYLAVRGDGVRHLDGRLPPDRLLQAAWTEILKVAPERFGAVTS